MSVTFFSQSVSSLKGCQCHYFQLKHGWHMHMLFITAAFHCFCMDNGPDELELEPRRKRPRVEPTFQVATWKSGGLNLRAFLSDGRPQWVYERIHKQLHSKREGGKYLRDNLETLKAFLAEHGVPSTELGYKTAAFQPTNVEPWYDHTVSSRALLGVIFYQMIIRKASSAAKQAAISLLHKLVAQLPGISARPVGLCLENDDGVLHRVDIAFTLQGVTQDWCTLLRLNSAALCIWEKLQKQPWCGHIVTSAGHSSTIQDIMLFLCYLVAHQKEEVNQCSPYHTAGKVILQDLFVWLGCILDAEAVALAEEPMQGLPMLKTLQGGHKKRADKCNQFILMNKLKEMKSNRKKVAATHDELAPRHGDLIEREAHITVSLYNAKVSNTFASPQCPRQFSIAWDPSDYGGRSTLVSTLYSPALDCAAYMPNQVIRKLIMSDLQPTFVEEAKASKLGTLEGYSELRALSFALMQATGTTLMDYRIPESVLARPLRDGETRVCCNGIWYIVGPGDLVRPEVPAHMDLATLPALVSCSDQGPSNTASLNFIQFAGEGLMVQVQYDCFHRGWNDVKLSAKKAKGYPWSVILKLVVLFNMNYSSFGSGAFFYKKQSVLQNFMETRTFRDPSFQAAIFNICRERGIPEPESLQEEEELFNSLPHMTNMIKKGPLIKLLRWMSFFEVALEWKGDMWATKLILQSDIEPDQPLEDQLEIEEQLKKVEQGSQSEQKQSKRDAKKEVDALKRASGVWKLAPKVVTQYNIDTLDMLLLVCKATWKCHAERARSIVHPAQVLEHNLACCSRAFWAFELEEMVGSALWAKHALGHMYPKDKGNLQQLLENHTDFFHHLLNSRATSLASAHTLPPMRWHGVLLPNQQDAGRHRDTLLEEWGMILRLEAASLHSPRGRIDCLEKIFWRLGTYVRVLAMAHERDRLKGLSCQSGSAFPLQMLAARGLGDSRVIEVAHQSGPDIQRATRHNSISQISAMFGTIKSSALEQRKVHHVQIKPEEVIFSSGQRMVNVKKSMNPSSHKLDSGMQRMMRRRQGGNFWPSPAPASLFPSLACTEWALSFLKNEHPGATSLDDAWISCIAGRCGDLIAHKPSGQVCSKLFLICIPEKMEQDILFKSRHTTFDVLNTWYNII